MGMAASQARFLGLTARKSNVEYQGQQINQQRTALSNESANLYNEMMQLNVPTPPATSDFYSTSYVLTGSSDDYAKSDYKLGTIVKTYEHQNEYRVTLITNREYYQRVNQQYKIGMVSQAPSKDGSSTVYTIPLSDSATGRKTSLAYDTQKSGVFTEADVDLKKTGVEPNTIYAVGANAGNLGGLQECFPELFDDNGNVIEDKMYDYIPLFEEDENGQVLTDEEGNPIYKYVPEVEKDEEGNIIYEAEKNEDGTDKKDEEGNVIYSNQPVYKRNEEGEIIYSDEIATQAQANFYFYRDNNGENKFLTSEQLMGLLGNKEEYQENDYFAVAVANQYTKDETIQVIANLETSDSTGRYSTIQIDENPDYPTNLQGKIFTLDAVQEYDQKGYDDAYNDYEYQKGLYEKSISDINAKTEVIQNEDQQLELRLQQLNTEQNAIATEMDSVSKVIEDNVEKTFKVFA